MATQAVSLKDLRDTIEAELHTTDRVHDYCAYAKRVEEIITTQSPNEETKQFLLQALQDITHKVDPVLLQNGTAHSHMIDSSTACAEVLLRRWIDENNIIQLKKEKLIPGFREAFKEYWVVEPIDDTHVLRGGKARVWGRLQWGYQFNKADNMSDDVDMTVQEPFSNELIQLYGSSPRWVKKLPILNDEVLAKEMQSVDISTNQIFIGRDFVRYTDQAKNDLATHVAHLTAQGSDIYNTYDYQKNGQRIHDKSVLRRWFKFLVEEKLIGLELPKHAIDKRNIECMGMDNEFLVLLRMILDKDSAQWMQTIWNLGLLLCKLDIIQKPENVIDRTSQLIARNPKFNLKNKPETLEQDLAAKANRLVSKYIRAVFKVLENKEPAWLEKYTIDETNNMIVTLKLQYTKPNSWFQSTWSWFRKTIRA